MRGQQAVVLRLYMNCLKDLESGAGYALKLMPDAHFRNEQARQIHMRR